MYPPMIHQHTLQSWKIMESQSESIQTPSLTQTNISFPLFFPFSMLFQLSDLEHLGLEQKSNNPLYLPRPFAGWGRGGVQLEYSLTYPNPRGGVIHKEQHLRVPPLINHQSWEFLGHLASAPEEIHACLKALVIDDHGSEPLKNWLLIPSRISKKRLGFPFSAGFGPSALAIENSAVNHALKCWTWPLPESEVPETTGFF